MSGGRPAAEGSGKLELGFDNPVHVAACRALQQATWGHGREIARQLGVSARSVQNWGEPQARRRNPAHTLLELMAAALRCGRPPRQALGPLFFLAESLGFDVVERPRGRAAAPAPRQLAAVAACFGEFLQQAGAALAATEEGGDDGELRDRLRQLVIELHRLTTAVERRGGGAGQRPARGER